MKLLKRIHQKKSQHLYDDNEILHIAEPIFFKGHQRAPTSISGRGTKLYSGGKDCRIIQWDIETGKKTLFPGGPKNFSCGGHFESVMDLKLCDDNVTLASVGLDQVIRLWDTRLCGKACVATIKAHTSDITCLALQCYDGMESLCTGSKDRSVKVWNIKTRRVIDTLYGHTSAVLSMCATDNGGILTGGGDRTVRSWKLTEHSHLVYGPSTTSQCIDCVAGSSSSRVFSSGYQDGSLTFWTANSRKPAHHISNAHGGSPIISLANGPSLNRWITGSSDGNLRIWETTTTDIKEPGKRLVRSVVVKPTLSAFVPGCINSIHVGEGLVALAVGREHKLGRWETTTKSANGITILRTSALKS